MHGQVPPQNYQNNQVYSKADKTFFCDCSSIHILDICYKNSETIHCGRLAILYLIIYNEVPRCSHNDTIFFQRFKG